MSLNRIGGLVLYSTMLLRFIQINLNRSWPAYNLMNQHIIEEDIHVGILSEPPSRRSNMGTCNYLSSNNGLAAVIWRADGLPGGCSLIRRGRDYVAVKANQYIIVSCYVSPQTDRRYYLEFLDSLGDIISDYNNVNIIIGGDFNARSPSWNSGASCNFRGGLLEEWAAEGDIRLVNRGVSPTSVNPRGSAVVDLTWITSNMVGRMLDWRVDVDGESLSDHNYIRFNVVEEVPLSGSGGSATANYPRWNYGLLDSEMLVETLEWSCMDSEYLEQDSWNSARSASLWIDRTLANACDMAAPRAGKAKRRESAHWWSAGIAELRLNSVRAKRQLTKFNSRYSRRIAESDDGFLADRRLELRRIYKDARRNLRKAIQDAKLQSWRELLASIDADPWGRPYLLVLGRLRRARPGLTETLEEEELQPLLDSLFPLGAGCDMLGEHIAVVWTEEWNVSPVDILTAVWKKRYSNTAPGLDGVRSVI